MGIRNEVVPFVVFALAFSSLIALIVRVRFRTSWSKAVVPGAVLAFVSISYLLYFFRDPERFPPADPASIVSGADGVIAKITNLTSEEFKKVVENGGLKEKEMKVMEDILEQDVVRISIFLSLINVHVNRAPIAGDSVFLGYYPGKHIFTFNDKSSDVNQHNSIYISGGKTECMINQIVGPVCRRVVYFLDKEKTVKVEKGDRIGMMKFGSRLDMYFPKDDLTDIIQENTDVRAGETIIARLVDPEKE